MVNKVIHKNKILYAIMLAVIAPLATIAIVSTVRATDYTCEGADQTCTGPEVTFEVNVKEVLQVAVTTPTGWNSANNNGAVNYNCTDAAATCALLRNKYTIGVVSNNVSGFTISMTSGDSSTDGTALKNEYTESSSTIPTLTSSKTAEAMLNAGGSSWGFSLDDADTASASATYSGIAAYGATSPNLICKQTKAPANLESGDTDCSTKSVYFGATSDGSIDSGTYSGSVIISVVSGVSADGSNTNPTNPVDNNPATPDDTSTTNPNKSYTQNGGNTTTGYTTYTQTTTSGSGSSAASTTTTTVSKGDNTTAYAAVQGVTNSNIGEGTPLATGLAVTAAIAAASGTVFFILAKRQKDDNEEEEA